MFASHFWKKERNRNEAEGGKKSHSPFPLHFPEALLLQLAEFKISFPCSASEDSDGSDSSEEAIDAAASEPAPEPLPPRGIIQVEALGGMHVSLHSRNIHTINECARSRM